MSAKHTPPKPFELKLAGEVFSAVSIGDLDPDYRRQPKTQHFCCLCQRDIKTPVAETAHLHFVDGGNGILAVADEDRYQAASTKEPGGQFSGEMGCFPVGADCARKLPQGFVLPAKARAAISKATSDA